MNDIKDYIISADVQAVSASHLVRYTMTAQATSFTGALQQAQAIMDDSGERRTPVCVKVDAYTPKTASAYGVPFRKRPIFLMTHVRGYE